MGFLGGLLALAGIAGLLKSQKAPKAPEPAPPPPPPPPAAERSDAETQNLADEQKKRFGRARGRGRSGTSLTGAGGVLGDSAPSQLVGPPGF